MSSGGGKKEFDPGESAAELALPDDARRVPAGSRITLGFSGPPLTLPEDEKLEPLTLDTDELHQPPATPSETTEAPEEAPLELDLDSFVPARRSADSSDAWTLDHRRRSTPPPALGLPLAPVHAPSAARPAPTRSASAGPALPVGDGGALGLVERSRPSQPDLDLAAEMAERYALGDFTGALRAAELLLGHEDVHPEARRYADSSRERLVQLYESRVGDMAQVPVVKVPASEIRWLGLDHRAGFLLSRVDGQGNVEQLIDISGMPRLEVLKTLVELLDADAIELR
ncbi:MAG: hypothetical protein GXP55_08370 [Deltaproteobacteria bacterium]|nr:hypothetical protein [Deltaproteobacteria bacterium]